jgi:hypothetical protein
MTTTPCAPTPSSSSSPTAPPTILEGADAKTRQAVRQTLQHWQQDPDFAGVRGEEALAKLPEEERKAWQQLWAEVETLRQKAAAANAP